MSENETSETWGRNPRAQMALDEWERIFLHRDWDALPDLLAGDAIYYTPADALPLHGKVALVRSLRFAVNTFETFEYAGRFGGDEGHVLEFRGRVGDTAFTGIDIIRFDGVGKIAEIVVMIRPIAAIMKLGEEAARRMATANQTAQD